MFQRICVVVVLSLSTVSAWGDERGEYFEAAYPASSEPGELVFGVNYTVWIPPGASQLRGVIVHQHGCGSGACKGGATAAYDLHWQALAQKWNCALLGPSYRQQDSENCRLWCDPRNGSSKTFMRALHDLAVASGHAELETVPWCLWGHSGGGFWASLMQTLYPERIVAIWFRSGTAIEAWERGEIPRPEVPAAAFGIPMMCNPGSKERDDMRFRGAWTGAERMFQFYRAKNAPIGMALDPRTGHECGDARYLAIPFFDACLELRLPAPGANNQTLRPIDVDQGWLAPLLDGKAVAAKDFSGAREQATWLPNEPVARDWQEYVTTGFVSDSTPPPPPAKVTVELRPNSRKLTWRTDADLESGIAGFVVFRDGREIGRVPEMSTGRFGKGLFQTMSYHDTPEKPLPEMVFVDDSAPADAASVYEIAAENAAGVRSARSQPAVTRKLKPQ